MIETEVEERSGYERVSALGTVRRWWASETAPGWLTQATGYAPLLLAASVVLAAVRAALSGKSWMIFFEDDFYYYLKVAQNLAHGSGSTFNGIVATNGYHPLWMLLLTAFSRFSSQPHTIFLFVAAVTLGSTLATFFLAREVLAQAGIGYVPRQLLAAYIGIYALHVFYTGMEVILAVPLVFLAMAVAGRRNYWQRGFWPACSLGLIVSAMVLARLDLILFAGMMLVGALVNGEVRRSLTVKQIAGLGLGLVPLAAYFLVNHVSFGVWLPVSGMAKQMKFNHLPTLRPWLTPYSPNINNRLNQLPIHLAILCLPFAWKRLSTTERVIFPAALLFPFVYVFLLSCISDWQLWLWYLYPLRAALCVSFAIFWKWPRTERVMRTNAFAMVMLVVLVGEFATSKWWTDVQPALHDAAVDIQGFAKTHPGVYAMGDRSGMVAYLIPYPVVQTEGLVMDGAYIERMRRQEPLLPALADYHVRYYVGTAWEPYTGCFHAVEPFQAAKTSAHMVGDLCSQPVASFQHENFRTRIFDLEKEPGAKPH